MSPHVPPPEGRKPLRSAHVCPECGLSIELKDIGLTEVTTGLITCPKCDWSGQIEIEIIEKKSRE
jgi:hypothetical protein